MSADALRQKAAKFSEEADEIDRRAKEQKWEKELSDKIVLLNGQIRKLILSGVLTENEFKKRVEDQIKQGIADAEEAVRMDYTECGISIPTREFYERVCKMRKRPMDEKQLLRMQFAWAAERVLKAHEQVEIKQSQDAAKAEILATLRREGLTSKEESSVVEARFKASRGGWDIR